MSTAPHTSVAPGTPIVADAPAKLAGARVVPALRYVLGVVLLAAGYYGVGQASLALQYTGPVAAIWLPVGVGVAALYLGGLRFWPGILIGDLALADSAQPLGSALGLTLGNMADVFVITLLLRRLLGPRGALDRLERVGVMLAAIAAGAAITATVAMVSLRAGDVIGSSDVPTFWRSWFLADASGSLVVVPLALAWAQPGSLEWSRRDVWQGALLLAAVVALSAIALSGDLALTYMVFPALIGAALRFGERGATLAVAVAAGLTVGFTANEMGAFVSHSITDSALSTQLYLAVSALTTLCLAAIVGERKRAGLDLAASERSAGERAAEERHRIARDLHDSVSQSLFSARLHLRTAERALTSEGMDSAGSGGQELARAQQLTAAALAEMRALVYELRPDGLADDGLVVGLTRHATAVSACEDVAIVVRGPEERLPLTPDAEEQLYRLCQEAIGNVIKHAGASEAAIDVGVDEGTVAILIRDDGCGFDPATVSGSGFGVRSMRTRAAEAGGRLDITSVPGRGTVVLAEVPAHES
jgi:signal transduction histidine kinase